eukprot:GHVR01035641.1.p1 GENE.GHVR01035641.1~~GHVR01035641.1.p1  ORF type:complete len:127 (-),score=8.09 GHVR01035641.1:570-950(-)
MSIVRELSLLINKPSKLRKNLPADLMKRIMEQSERLTFKQKSFIVMSIANYFLNLMLMFKCDLESYNLSFYSVNQSSAKNTRKKRTKRTTFKKIRPNSNHIDSVEKIHITVEEMIKEGESSSSNNL